MEALEVTINQVEKLKAMLETMSGGPLKIEVIKGNVYVFGSELQCLRLERQYPRNDKFKADYSVNMGSWFFRIEL